MHDTYMYNMHSSYDEILVTTSHMIVICPNDETVEAGRVAVDGTALEREGERERERERGKEREGGKEGERGREREREGGERIMTHIATHRQLTWWRMPIGVTVWSGGRVAIGTRWGRLAVGSAWLCGVVRPRRRLLVVGRMGWVLRGCTIWSVGLISCGQRER